MKFRNIVIAMSLFFTCLLVVGDVWYYGSGEAVNLENKIGFDKHSQKIISNQATDPTTSPGISAATGSIIMHTASGAYIKTGPNSTDWKLIVDQRFLDNTSVPHGWEGHSNSSLSYNVSNQTLTVTYTPSEKVWFNGKFINKTSSEATSHANSVGSYFFYFNSAGTISATTAGGMFVWESEVPIASVYYNNSADAAPWDGPDYVLFDERHTVHIPYAAQKEMHYADGVVLSGSGFTITGTYSTATGSGTIAENSYGIDTGTFLDQDFAHSFIPLTDNAGIGNQYPVWYRIGASNEWRWVINNVPYYGGTNINYNLNTAGTYSLAETSNGSYVNMYAVTWNTYGANNTQRFAWIMGQSQYSTLALAQGENITSLNLTGIPAYEILPLYRVTMRCQSTYDDTGKNTRIEAVTRITDTRVNITLTYNPSAAAAVTVNTTNFGGKLSASDTTVQTALDTLDDHYHNIASGNYIIASGNLITSGSGTNYQKVDAKNQIINGDFEQGISLVTCTTGTCYHDSTAISGGKSLRISLSSQTASVTNQAYTNSAYTGKVVEVACAIKSSLSTAQLCAVNASGAEINCNNYDGSNIWKVVPVTFTAATGTFTWKIKTSASATGDIYVDDCYGGDIRSTSLYGVNTITAWTSGTCTSTHTSNATTTCMWRRVGENMQVQYVTTYTGATTGSALTYDLPAGGYTINTSKLLFNATNLGPMLNGHGTYYDVGAATIALRSRYSDADSISVMYTNDSGSPDSVVDAAFSNSAPSTIANGDYVSFFLEVPITGWSANDQYVVTPATTGMENYYIRQLAQDLTDRTAGLRFNFAGTITLQKNNATITQAQFQNSSSNLLYIVDSGDPTLFYASQDILVTINASMIISDQYGGVFVYTGSSKYYYGTVTPAASKQGGICTTFKLNAGDYFYIIANGSTPNDANPVDVSISVTAASSAFLSALPVAKWESFTPTGSWLTNASYSGMYKLDRNSSTVSMRYTINLTGNTTSANLTVNLPSGLTIDTSRLPNLGSGTGMVLGTARYAYPGFANGLIHAIYNSTSNIAFQYQVVSGSDVLQAPLSNSAPHTVDNGDSLFITILDLPVTY